MSRVAHHAIIVTGSYGDFLDRAHAEATSIFPKEQVSAISQPVINDYQSFAVFSDGSKEHWPESDDGDSQRDRFVSWLEGAKVTRSPWAKAGAS